MKAITVAAFALALTLLCSGPLLAQSGNDLYQQALVKERAEGDVQGAIELYQRIAREFAADRPLAAKALVQMGLCYEKLGLTEARQAYQEVIDGFPEQQGEVAVARERLALLAQALAELETGPTFRKLEIASKPQNGVISPDGTQLAFISQESLWRLPLQGPVGPGIAGEPVRLTEPMGAWNVGNILAWSGDGEWIAFNATVEDSEQIYLVSVATGELREIPGNHFRGSQAWNYRLSLSPDGGTLAFVHMEGEGLRGGTPDCPASDLFVHTHSVDSVESTRLAPVCTMQPSYSPDGNYIAYIRVLRDVSNPEEVKRYHQLWVMTATGGTPEMLVDSALIWSPVWSPDGTMIAVLSETETGTLGQPKWIRIIPFSPGRGLREPIARFELPSASNGLLVAGWTPDGELGVHQRSAIHRAVYTAPVEGGRAVQVTPELAEGYFPRWSPDGTAIILTANLHYDGNSWIPMDQASMDTLPREVWRDGEDYFFGLVSIPPEGGVTTPIRITGDTRVVPGVPPGGGVHVSPDGKTILFAAIRYPDPEPGSRPSAEVDLWTVPLEGGEPTRLARSPLQDRWPCWSPDGGDVAFLRYESKGKGAYTVNIQVMPAEGGESIPITSDADSVEQATIAYSPDGKRIAFFSNGAIKTIPADGGDPEVLIPGVPSEAAGRHRLAWSPDGRTLAYTAAGKIWLAPVDGGEAVELRTGLPEDTVYGDFGWSPDGRKITFKGTRGGGVELWMISDFLR